MRLVSLLVYLIRSALKRSLNLQSVIGVNIIPYKRWKAEGDDQSRLIPPSETISDPTSIPFSASTSVSKFQSVQKH